MVAAVDEFFKTGAIRESINYTIVAITPKVPHPKSISLLRPIRCCNYIFKIISKIMVRRLKPYLNGLISPQQSSFIGGRLIQDNLVVAQKAFQYLKNKNKFKNWGFAIKFDMNKAYDRVDWSFLQEALLDYGFSVNWVSLVMSLVSSIKYCTRLMELEVM